MCRDYRRHDPLHQYEIKVPFTRGLTAKQVVVHERFYAVDLSECEFRLERWKPWSYDRAVNRSLRLADDAVRNLSLESLRIGWVKWSNPRWRESADRTPLMQSSVAWETLVNPGDIITLENGRVLPWFPQTPKSSP
jgi:hypothetical protein